MIRSAMEGSDEPWLTMEILQYYHGIPLFPYFSYMQLTPTENMPEIKDFSIFLKQSLHQNFEEM